MDVPAPTIFVTAMLKRAAQQHPNNICSIDAATGRRSTYKETEERVSRIAGAMRRMGLSPGGRVALVMLNCDRYLESFFSCPWADGIVVPINIRLAPAEMIEVFNDCKVEFIMVDEAFKGILEAIKGQIPSLKRVIYAGDAIPPKGTISYGAMIETGPPVHDAMRGGDNVFGLFYTGGTTGKPKGVMLTHGNIVINALGHVAMLHYSTESSYLHSAPMFHLADGASSFGITMVAGTHVFIPKFVPEDMLKAIEKYKVNKAMMVPAMIAMMLQVEDQSQYDCSSLQNIIYGASPMPEALLAPAMSKFPNAQFMQGYGMTETSPAITMLPSACHTPGNPKMRAVGRPVPWAEVKIADEKDNEVSRGTVGQILTRGPHVMKGKTCFPFNRVRYL